MIKIEFKWITYFADAGGGAGDEDNFSGDIFWEKGTQKREEEFEDLERWQEKHKGEEGEGESCKVEKRVD